MFLIVLVALLMGCNGTLTVDNTPIDKINLERYLGSWYEIARFDHSFEGYGADEGYLCDAWRWYDWRAEYGHQERHRSQHYFLDMSICINEYPYKPLYINDVRTRAKEKFPFLCQFTLRGGAGSLSAQLDNLNGRTLLADWVYSILKFGGMSFFRDKPKFSERNLAGISVWLTISFLF